MDINYLKDILLSIGLTFFLAVTGLCVLHFLSKRIAQMVRSLESITGERRQQLLTVIQILRWGLNVLVVVGALLMILSNFVDIAPLLASVGVVGLALSLGAQQLVRDLISGFFILIENQYGIGDVIKVGDIAGSVERFTLRVTWVRDVEGQVHIIPNGEVRTVTNITKNWSRAIVEVGVAYEEDLDRVLAVLEEIAEDFVQSEEYAPDVLEPPTVIGPLGLGDWAVTMRVMVKTKPGKHWTISRELKRRILLRFSREGIEMPYPRQEVLVRNEGAF